MLLPVKIGVVCVCVGGAGVGGLKAVYDPKKDDFSRVSPLSERIKKFWAKWSVY